MKSFGFVKKLFLYDYYNRPEENGVKDIELCISSDYDVHFSNDKYFKKGKQDFSLKNGYLYATHYHGKIYVPKFTSIEILDTERTVVGITASLMHISTNGTLDLIIEKNSGLKLCLENFERVAVNGIKFYESFDENNLDNDSINYRSEYADEPFDYYEEKYHTMLLESTTSKIVDSLGSKHVEKLGKFHIENLNICRYYDLVYVNKRNSISSIVYDLPTKESISSRKKDKFEYLHYKELMKEKNVEKYFMNLISYAKNREDFEKIILQIDDKINNSVTSENFEDATKLSNTKKLLENIISTKSK